MRYSRLDLQREAQEALDRVWFVQSVEEIEHTDLTLSLRLHIQPGLFVQVFLGELTHSLYFALVHEDQRIFGLDREGDQWHLHPYGNPDNHEPLTAGLEPKPLLRFLARVEDLLLEHDLL
jgi:hypothetical protein